MGSASAKNEDVGVKHIVFVGVKVGAADLSVMCFGGAGGVGSVGVDAGVDAGGGGWVPCTGTMIIFIQVIK